MFRTRDFYLVKVFDLRGKYLGIVDDVSIDFHSGKLKGLVLSTVALLKKKNYIDVDDIVSFQECVIVRKISYVKLKDILTFKKIKYMDIVNTTNEIIGVLEDLLIDNYSFIIKGLVMSSGLFDKMIKGKDIINIKTSILCENYILYLGGNSITFQSLPHTLGGIKNER